MDAFWKSLSLHDEDVIVFYTDGATDVPKHSIDEQQWCELVTTAARASDTSEGTADNIRDALEQVLPLDQRNVDIALLIIKLLKSTTPPIDSATRSFQLPVGGGSRGSPARTDNAVR